MTARTSSSNPASAGLQQELVEEVARIQALLLAHETGGTEARAGAADPVPSANRGPLDGLVAAFGLTSFERDLLMLCAAVELDAAVAETVNRLLMTPDPRPTLGLQQHQPRVRLVALVGGVSGVEQHASRGGAAGGQRVDASALRVDGEAH